LDWQNSKKIAALVIRVLFFCLAARKANLTVFVPSKIEIQKNLGFLPPP